jgi:photosystem II stability/assembly factor-like uncharacterized protein
MNDIKLEKIYNINNTYVNTNYKSLIKLQKGITLNQPKLNIGDIFFIDNEKIYFKKLYVNASNPYSDEVNQYIDIYGGLGITSNLFLDGKLNIKSDFNIDYIRRFAPLEVKNLTIHIGNSEIFGLTTIFYDFTINGDAINRKDFFLINDAINNDYNVEKNIYGNIFTITNQLVTYNDIYTDILNLNSANIITNQLFGNVNTQILWSNVAILGNITATTTELGNLENIGNLNLTGLIVNSVETISNDHSKIFINNVTANGIFIFDNDVYTNILNTPSLISDKIINSNSINVKEDLYLQNVRLNGLITTIDPIQQQVAATNVYATNSVVTQEIFSQSVIFNGDVFINGLFNFINSDVFSIVDTILTLNKPAVGLGQRRDAGIFHIYNNDTEVPALLYKLHPQTSNISPVQGLSDIIVFGNVNIKDIISGKPLSNIYFNNADVIGLHSVYMNSINGNIFNNLIIGKNSDNIFLGNTHLYSNTFIENLNSPNIIISTPIFVPNLFSNIFGNTFNLSSIKPYNNNLIINQLIIDNIYPNDIQGNNLITPLFQTNSINLLTNNNSILTANIVTNGNVQSNLLYTNNLTTRDINIDGNLLVYGNVNTNELYIQDKLSPTINITSNTTITTHQNIIFQNKNNSIFATLNNTYINDTKNFVLDEINGFPCYVITNNGTFYLNNSYSYLTLYFDGFKWFSLDSTPITSTFNSKFTSNINSNIGKSIVMNYYGNIICAGGPDDNYGMFKYLKNTGSWIESNIVANIPFTKFGNPLTMSGDGNTIVVGCENEGNVFVYKNLNLVQDISLKYKLTSIGVSYNGNIIAFGLNSVLGNLGCLQIYKYNGTNWIYKDSILPENHIGSSSIGDSIDMSINGDVIVFGGSQDNNGIGKVWIYNEITSSNVYINYNNNNNVNKFLFDTDNGNLYVGGTFTSINSVATIGGGLIDTTSNTVIKFGNVNGNINSIAKYNGNIYYAGNFTNIDGIVANSIAYWNGSNWNRLGNGIIGTINSIDIGYGNIYIGGRFNLIDGQPFNNVAVWNLNTSSWRNIGGINGEVKNILYHNQTVYIGGNFSSVNITGTPFTANNIASYNIETNLWNRIQNGINGNVEKIYQYKDEIYVSGSFTKYGIYNGNFGKIISNTTLNNLIPRNYIGSWSDISLSETGQYQSICARNGNIWLSSDYGLTWTNTMFSKDWLCIAISSTGQYQTAGDFNNTIGGGGNIYTSSDFGLTWQERATAQRWTAISISNNGQFQCAVASNNNFIYTSYDYGIEWIPRLQDFNWSDISMSASGQYISASSFFSNLYVSSDYGITWTPKQISLNNWSSIAISGTGQYQSATRNGGNIFISSDFGNTWTPKGLTSNWERIRMSSSGRYQVASDGNLYFSNDYGMNWVIKNPLISAVRKPNISKNGKYISVGGANSFIYTSYPEYSLFENSGLTTNGPIYEIFGYDNYLLVGGLFTNSDINFTIYITPNITYQISYSLSGNNIIQYNIDNKSVENLPFEITGTIRNIYYDDIMYRYYVGGNNLLYYHSGLSYQYEQYLVSNNYIGSSRQGSYIKYKDYELLVGSKESNAYWKWTKYGDYWYDDNYNKNSYNINKFASSDNFKNIYTNSGNIVIQNQNIGNDYYDDYNIILPESGNINGIACNYNSSKLVAGINSNLYIYS